MAKLQKHAHLVVLAGLVALLVGVSPRSGATPTLFETRCDTCHNDDSSTCAGCHQHRGTLIATADQTVYAPGQLVTVTLDHSNSYSGWIRGLLYDDQGAQIDITTGPTGTGDDGLGNPITFPVDLQAEAPSEPGTYVWEAAWFGGNNTGTGHFETRTPVTVTVEIDTGVEAWPVPTAETRLRLAVHPNPITRDGRLTFSAPPGEAVTLAIVDPSGRRVRGLVERGAGRGEIVWDGLDDAARPVAAGTYVAVFYGSGGHTSRTLLVVR